jgi:hypothetical protein
MYIRIADIPESTMKPVMEEFQAELEENVIKKVRSKLFQLKLNIKVS